MHVLIDQLTIKFGKSDATESKVKLVGNATKLDAALRIILSAQSTKAVAKYIGISPGAVSNKL